MKWNDVLRKLKRYGDRETLVDIVDKYSTQEGRRKDDLIDFIENSSNRKFNHMVDTLEEALLDRMQTGNKQRKIYLVDLGLSYDRNNFEYRIEQKYGHDNDGEEVDSYDGGRRRRRKRTRRKRGGEIISCTEDSECVSKGYRRCDEDDGECTNDVMEGGRRRRKRGGVPLGHRCGTNADCDEGLQCDLQALLSGSQVDNNQRGICKTSEGGKRRRRKRTRRKKKSKRRRKKRRRTKKKRRRRRRK